MSARKRRLVTALVGILTGLLPACSSEVPVDQLPPIRATLAAAGKRLSASLSEKELSALGRHGDRLLAALNQRERAALGRGSIRFRVDRPVVIAVAAPARAIPFWLRDGGFAPTDDRLRNADGEFLVYRKAYLPGPIGLGVNGLDRSSPAHYAVFVLPQVAGERVRVSDIRPSPCRAVAAAEGISPYVNAERPFDHLPPGLRDATLLQTSNEQRHAGALLSGRAWKTHVPSSARPDQIVLSFGADASRSLTWTWRTQPQIETSALRLAKAAPNHAGPADTDVVRVVQGDSLLVETGNILNDPAIRRHRISVNDLEPDTVYAYAVGDGSESGWGPWGTVKTGPEAGRDFRFLYLGDAQTGLENWGRLLHNAYQRYPDIGFILMAGDLVDRGNERSNWDHFFLRAAGVFDRVPMMPCVGNHEYLDRGPRLYRSFLALPGNGPAGMHTNLVYSFEYADALFAVLDSTQALSDSSIGRRQAEWLDATLRRSRATWKFVMFHHPLYASHPSRESSALRDVLVPIFDKYHVDLVLQGHDHAYLRTYPMRASRRVDSTEEGTVYVVSVSGDKFYDQDPRDYTAHGLTQTSTYQVIDVHGRRLSYRACDARGREVDSFVIEKRADFKTDAIDAGGKMRSDFYAQRPKE